MSIFDAVKNAIFGKAKAGAQQTADASAPSPAPASTPSDAATPSASASAPAPSAPAGAAPTPTAAVDVAAIMDAAVAAKGQTLNWRTSIVDMMKALDLDSSLDTRKKLADELGYTGDKSDSATMNIWLHQVLMKKLAENGGKVPANLLS